YKVIIPIIISSCLVGCGGGSSTGKEDNNTSVSKPTVPNKPTTLNNEHKLDGLWVFDNNKFAIHTSVSGLPKIKIIETNGKGATIFSAKVSELDGYIELQENDRFGNLEKKVNYKSIGNGNYVNIDDDNEILNIVKDDIGIDSLKLFNR
ncbi:hypothetical protein C1141_21240, partial [Vibrio agarivorans]